MGWIFDQVKQVLITKDCDDLFFVNYLKEWRGDRYEEYQDHLLLYIEEDGKKILLNACSSTSSLATKKITFAKYLLNMKELTYKNVLVGLVTYNNFLDGANRWPPFYSPPGAEPIGEPYQIIDEVLESTNGYLVFSDQLEKIYMILVRGTHADAVKFRKDINAKRPAAKELANSILLRPRYSLLDLLKQCCWDTENMFVYTPPYHDAMILYAHLRKRYASVIYENIIFTKKQQ